MFRCAIIILSLTAEKRYAPTNFNHLWWPCQWYHHLANTFENNQFNRSSPPPANIVQNMVLFDADSVILLANSILHSYAAMLTCGFVFQHRVILVFHRNHSPKCTILS